MLLSWKIRCLNRKNRQFYDRLLRLDTESLDATTRAVIELAMDADGRYRDPTIVRLRHLFTEAESLLTTIDQASIESFLSVSISGYFEDELGARLSENDIAKIVSGSESAIHIPSGTSKHDIELKIAEPIPLPATELPLDKNTIDDLGYFTRELREMRRSAFLSSSPARLNYGGTIVSGTGPKLQTYASDEEIRSFVTIFRRLYMENERVNFVKAVNVFTRAVRGHPYEKWATSEKKAFLRRLGESPKETWFIGVESVSFTVRQLLDGFIYSQYAHQPDRSVEENYERMLIEVGGNRDVLMCLFLRELASCSRVYLRLGRLVEQWFEYYCKTHNVWPASLSSLSEYHEGIGTAEKENSKFERLLEEKAIDLAIHLCQQAGSPISDFKAYLEKARIMIRKGFE